MSRPRLRAYTPLGVEANGRRDCRVHIALTTWFQRSKQLLATVHERELGKQETD